MVDAQHNLPAIAEAIPHLVWTSRPDGSVDYANRHWYDVTGLTVDQTLGWGWLQALHPDDVGATRQRWQQVLATGENPNMEYRLRTADGMYRWHRVYAAAVRDEAGRIIKWFGTVTDIDDLRRAEERMEAERARLLLQAHQSRLAAEAERQRLQSLFMQAPALIVILRGREGICELYNPRFRALWGERDVIGKPMREAWPELEGQGYFELVEHVFDSGEPVFGEEYPAMINRHNNGNLEEAFFSFVFAPYRGGDGAVEGIMIHGVDVTDHVRARRAVEESEHRLNLALDAAQMGAWDLDLVHDTAVRSLRHDQIFGYDSLRPEWGSRIFFGHVVPEDHEYAQSCFRKAFDTGQLDLQCRIRWPDGSIHWIDTRGRVFRDQQGQPVRMLGVVTDITERKQLERQKDDFISIASHELKTPLAGLQGYTQLMQRAAGKRGDDVYERHLAKMAGQVDRLARLMSDLLDVTRIQQATLPFHPQSFSLAACVTETVEELREITSSHRLLLIGTIERPVYGDPERIGQVVNNLLSNAVKYSPDADTVVVTLEEDGDNAVVSVQDFGIGIAREQHHLVFDRFFRGDDPEHQIYPGLGIGLYLSAAIIKQHGGRIWLDSDKGAGAVFRFSLPFAADT